MARTSGDKPAGNEKVGKVKEVVGWATGDRAVEAEGHAQHEKAAQEGPDANVTEEELDAETEKVRRAHGDTR